MPAPVRLRHMQSLVVGLLAAAIPTATVVWGDQRHHRDASAAIRIEVRHVSGPAQLGRFGRGQVYAAPSSATLTVPAPVVGVRYWAGINGVDVYVDAIIGDTATTVRDRLLTVIAALASDILVTPTASGPASILLTPTVPGALYGLVLQSPLTGTVGTTSPYRLRSAATRTSLELQAYIRRGTSATMPSLHDGATAVLIEAATALSRDAALSQLQDAGFGLESVGAPVNLTAIAGGDVESRAALDVSILAPIHDFEPVDVIERVEGSSVLFSDPPNTIALASIVAP